MKTKLEELNSLLKEILLFDPENPDYISDNGIKSNMRSLGLALEEFMYGDDV